MPNLSAAFCQEYLRTFQIRLVDSADLQREARRLRYQVYCVENAFEPPNEAEVEQDRFDERAPHALLFHRKTSVPVGTVRLVLPDAGDRGDLLPIYAVCRPDILAKAALPANETGEISRFSISKERLHQALGHHRGYVGGEDTRQILTFACLGLITAVRQIAHTHGITHLAAIMRPALLRRLRTLGLSFVELNERVFHHGVRVPCYTKLDRLEAHLQRNRPDLWTVFGAPLAA